MWSTLDAPIADLIVRLVLEFARAFGIGETEACDWICANHPDLTSAVIRMRGAREDALRRVGGRNGADD